MSTKRFIAKNGVDNNNQTIINVADPVNAGDVSNKRTTDGIDTRAGLAFSQANSAFIQANNAYAAANNVAPQLAPSFNRANSAYDQANTGVTQAQASFLQANTGTLQAQASFGQANTGTTQAQSAFVQANSAYSTANTKFNTSGGNITGTVTISSNLTVTGNLTVSGNVTTINANNLSLQDNMFYLNSGSTVANPDLGFAGNYNDGIYHHAGFFRDASDGYWKVFDNYLPEPDASPYIDTSNSSFRIADFQANNVTANSFSGTANNSNYLNGYNNIYYTNASNLSTGTLPNSRLSVVPNSALQNSSVTIGSTSVSLGSTVSSFAGVTLTSPTFTTPVLGTPSSGNFSTGTFTWPTFNQNTTGSAGSCTGNAATATSADNIDGIAFKNSNSTSSFAVDTQATNGIGYSTGYTLFGQTDGGVYCSTYDGGWQHQINGDFRTGQIAIRGKNNGTWQAWRTVLDSSNYSSYAMPAGGTTTGGGIFYFLSNKGAASYVGGNNTYALEAYSTDAGAAGMSFHRGGAYAVNMGLDPDNVFRIGGWSASSNRLQMDMSGNLTMAGNVTAYSDRKLKKDIETIPNALESVMKLRGVNYTRIDTERKGTGVIAQEIQEIIPEVVMIDNGGTLSVSYGNVIGYLIEAIKEQQIQIEKQSVELNNLKNLLNLD